MSKIVTLKSGEYARLDPRCSGFAHGFGVFETIRLSDGKLEFWKAHYDRLSRSANAFDLHFEQSEEALLGAIRQLVRSEGLWDNIVKLSLLKEGADACCYVYTRSVEPPGESVKLHLNRQSPLNEHSVLAGHKTHNYMESMYLKQSAVKVGFYDVVRLNTAGFVSETAVANLFFVKDSNLYTSALSTGILPGVIRAEVLQIAKEHSIVVEEGSYPVEFLKASDAVFLTNSTVGILSVDSIEAEDFSVTFNCPPKTVEILKIAFEDTKKRKSVALADKPEPKEL